MPRKINITGGKHSTMITTDLNSVKMKSTLMIIAENKGMTLTNFVRSLLYKTIEETPMHMKVRRRLDGDDD